MITCNTTWYSVLSVYCLLVYHTSKQMTWKGSVLDTFHGWWGKSGQSRRQAVLYTKRKHSNIFLQYMILIKALKHLNSISNTRLEVSMQKNSHSREHFSSVSTERWTLRHACQGILILQELRWNSHQCRNILNIKLSMRSSLPGAHGSNQSCSKCEKKWLPTTRWVKITLYIVFDD